MSCLKWEADIALYAGGDLPAGRIGQIEWHLGECGDCRALLEELRASQALLSELQDEPLDQAMVSQVRRRVLARVAAEEPGMARRYWKRALAPTRRPVRSTIGRRAHFGPSAWMR